MTGAVRRTTLASALPDPVGLDVVDLGCGTGALARLVLERGARSVLALDLDPDRLDVARSTARGSSVEGAVAGAVGDRLRFEQADLEQATLPFEAYDLACCTCLHRLADPVRFGRMVRSGLRQRAALVCVVEPGTAARLRDALERAGLETVGADRPGVLVATKPPRRAGSVAGSGQAQGPR